jgi:hypothetical protein
LVLSCERLRTAPLRALSPGGLFVAMKTSIRRQRARRGDDVVRRAGATPLPLG